MSTTPLPRTTAKRAAPPAPSRKPDLKSQLIAALERAEDLMKANAYMDATQAIHFVAGWLERDFQTVSQALVRVMEQALANEKARRP